MDSCLGVRPLGRELDHFQRADVVCAAVTGCSLRSTPLSHSTSPFEVLETARRLYGFLGQRLLCRFRARKFQAGEGLTPQAEEAARSAAKLVGEQLSALISQHRHE